MWHVPTVPTVPTVVEEEEGEESKLEQDGSVLSKTKSCSIDCNTYWYYYYFYWKAPTNN